LQDHLSIITICVQYVKMAVVVRGEGPYAMDS